MTKIVKDKDGTPLIDLCPVFETKNNIVVDLVGTPDDYEGVFEYNYKTKMWETVYEIEGSAKKN